MLTFKSYSKISKLVGILSGFMALPCIIFFLTEESARLFLGSITIVLTFIAIVSISYNCSVKIDTDKNIIEKEVQTLIFKKKVLYIFSDFDRVEILSAQGSDPNRAHITYLVHLAGMAKICIPGTTGNLDFASKKGRAIAKAINKPFNEKPKVGFILNLFERLT